MHPREAAKKTQKSTSKPDTEDADDPNFSMTTAEPTNTPTLASAEPSYKPSSTAEPTNTPTLASAEPSYKPSSTAKPTKPTVEITINPTFSPTFVGESSSEVARVDEVKDFVTVKDDDFSEANQKIATTDDPANPASWSDKVQSITIMSWMPCLGAQAKQSFCPEILTTAPVAEPTRAPLAVPSPEPTYTAIVKSPK